MTESQLRIVTSLIVIFLAIGLHEFAHAYVADLAGDPTPRNQGRVTLNLFRHFDPIGAVFILITVISGYGIGWGRPVQVNPSLMRNPRWGHFWSVAAGPLCNMLQACIYGLLLRLGPHFNSVGYVTLLIVGVRLNLFLCFFNLIPFGPLDGHWLVGAFMPDRMRANWFAFSAKVGTGLLFVLLLLGQAMENPPLLAILLPPVDFFTKLILGGHP